MFMRVHTHTYAGIFSRKFPKKGGGGKMKKIKCMGKEGGGGGKPPLQWELEILAGNGVL